MSKTHNIFRQVFNGKNIKEFITNYKQECLDILNEICGKITLKLNLEPDKYDILISYINSIIDNIDNDKKFDKFSIIFMKIIKKFDEHKSNRVHQIGGGIDEIITFMIDCMKYVIFGVYWLRDMQSAPTIKNKRITELLMNTMLKRFKTEILTNIEYDPNDRRSMNVHNTGYQDFSTDEQAIMVYFIIIVITFFAVYLRYISTQKSRDYLNTLINNVIDFIIKQNDKKDNKIKDESMNFARYLTEQSPSTLTTQLQITNVATPEEPEERGRSASKNKTRTPSKSRNPRTPSKSRNPRTPSKSRKSNLVYTDEDLNPHNL